MNSKQKDSLLQITIGNSNKDFIAVAKDFIEDLQWWVEQYFNFEVTTSLSSQKIQHRDLNIFLNFLITEEKNTQCQSWTPRLSRDFQNYLKNTLKENSSRRFSDKTIIRVLAHLKTFAKWVHKLRPFSLGNPMEKLKLPAVAFNLEIERAITPSQRRKILDAADFLLTTGGISKDRKRYKTKQRPTRKGYRPYRNRAIIYTLIETGMRRAAITKLNVDDVKVSQRKLLVEEKGSYQHTYKISQEGLQAICDYIQFERGKDAEYWQSPALFLPSSSIRNSQGRLAVLAVNETWNTVCKVANVEGKTPHSARHAMGKHIIDKTGNIAAVQKQLGHRNAVYSMQYARITSQELEQVLDER